MFAVTIEYSPMQHATPCLSLHAVGISHTVFHLLPMVVVVLWWLITIIPNTQHKKKPLENISGTHSAYIRFDVFHLLRQLIESNICLRNLKTRTLCRHASCLSCPISPSLELV